MTILKILEYPSDILLTPTVELTPEEAASEEIGVLIDNMIETCEDVGGLGLAAPQVGVGKSLCIFKIEDGNYVILINPKVVKSEGTMHWKGEGCLSLPEAYFSVKRAKKITVEFLNREGKKGSIKTISKRTAQRILHEIDHLRGILLISKGKRLK